MKRATTAPCARCGGRGYEEDFHETRAACLVCGGTGGAVPCAAGIMRLTVGDAALHAGRCGRPAIAIDQEEPWCYRHDPDVLRRVRAVVQRARSRQASAVA